MKQTEGYIKLLNENKDFLDAVEIEVSDREYLALRDNLFTELVKYETVSFTGSMSKYSQEQEVRVCLHRYMYLVAENILRHEYFAGMSFEEKEVRKMRLANKLAYIYNFIHAYILGNSELYEPCQSGIRQLIVNILTEEPLDQVETEVLDKITTLTTLEDEMRKNLIISNRKMYYLYMQQLLSLQEVESALRNDNENFFSNRVKLLRTVEGLKKENSECSWGTFDCMSSMKKIILDNKLKNQTSGWINWLLRGEEPTIEKHSEHHKKIAKFRDALKKDRITALLLEGDYPLRVLADEKAFTNSLALIEIEIKTFIGLFVGCVLPYLLVAFFMENREWIEKLGERSLNFDNKGGLIFITVLLILTFSMVFGYFWKNCYCYGSLKQTYSNEEKQKYLNSIWLLSLFEIIMVLLYGLVTIVDFRPSSMPKFPTKESLIQAKISDKKDIMVALLSLAIFNVIVSLIVQEILHLLNNNEICRLRYWKNYFTNTLYKYCWTIVITLIGLLCVIEHQYGYVIDHTPAFSLKFLP
ncbi:hypothetical protein NECID01_0411 [Nematocida sp. AWRm77]|nr:hypothetical protein NECID01_0411 [Nematocida sp. AWRm77]